MFKLFTLAHSLYIIEPQSNSLTSLARIFLLVHEIPATLSTSTSHVYSPFRASALDDPSSGNNFLGSFLHMADTANCLGPGISILEFG